MISTSKIRKIIAIKKNRSENGSRADPWGSNPHSKGEFFSRSVIVFLARIEDRSITTLAKMKVTIMVRKIIMIILSNCLLGLSVGSRMHFVLIKLF